MMIFYKRGIIHMPKSISGYIICAFAVIFLVSVFLAVDKESHSISDTLYGIFPYFVSTFLLVEWFASNTSD